MSKLDREIKAVFDEAFVTAEKIIPKMLGYMIELEGDELAEKIAEMLIEMKPKDYDDYIADLKIIFEQAGWIAPNQPTKANKE